MRDFCISTDSTASLPESYLKENNIAIHPLHYIIDGVEYGKDIDKELTDKEFYDSIRNGKMPTTSATNPGYIEKVMKEQIAQGYDILHIGFSSGISSSYSNAAMCANQIMEENPDCKIKVVDSLCAESGQALLVYHAVELKKQGKTMDEIVEWIEDNKLSIVHHFTVEDLFHLMRGGRLAKSTAIIGTALSIKPILNMNNEGKLSTIGKARGRKKAIKTLIDSIETNTDGFEVKEVFISHSDVLDEAMSLEAMIKEKYPQAVTMILPISPTVGAHTGVGTLLVSYFGNER